MKSRTLCTVAWLITLSSSVSYAAESYPEAEPAHTAGAAGEPGTVTLDATQQSRLGVVAETLSAAAAPAGSASIARVLDPGPLLALDSELAAASASFQASRAEAERTRKLFMEDRTASARAVEAANSQALADQQRVESARRRIVLEWGDGVANLTPARRSALLNDLARVRAELIRVELPLGVSPPKNGSSLEVRLNPDSPALESVVLGTLPAADPRLQTRGVLVEIKGDQANLAIGRMLTARVPATDGQTRGVVLPRGALLRKDSKVWAYVQTAPTTFIRREVSEYQPLADGWFVRKDFAAGDRIVAAGAAALFAIEAPAAAAD